MAIIFSRIKNETIYLDPRKGFEPQTVTSETRRDPLTGQISRIFPFRNLTLHRHDWTPFVEESLQKFCPFCPEVMEQVTPKFPAPITAAGRIRIGDAVAIPNLNPYDKHAAVVIMTDRHYVPMNEIDIQLITDSFRAGLIYLQRAAAVDPDGARYCSINWNYMPYSGGSLIHPHLQVIAGPEPCTFDHRMITASAMYTRNNKSNYWTDLVETEAVSDQRYIGKTGRLHWLCAFAPRHVGEVLGIMPGRRTIDDITDQDLAEMSAGLINVIKYYERCNIASFNTALYLARREDEGFTAHVRIVGRFTIFPLAGSDITHMQILHDDPWTVIVPEVMAEDIKKTSHKPSP